MRVSITVDALPGKRFSGQIEKIAILPDSSRSWLNPELKFYNCEVSVFNSHEQMRPGLSCQIEIIVQELEDALYVPVQSVMLVDNKPTAYVKTRRGMEPRIVETGLDNNRMIHIIGGLEEGEEVLLAPPLDKSEKNDKGNNGTEEHGKRRPGKNSK
jgi:HlyD family secretion protein